MDTRSEIVSFENEPLVLVDSADRVLGYLDKAACHNGRGKLHRAFSVFLFNPRGELLVQKRGSEKRLWPGYWSNSCCSHPRRGESMESAVHRRLEQELGLDGRLLHDLRFIYKFEYRVAFGAHGGEHELCWVYLARTTGTPWINTTEIDDWAWISGPELSRRLAERSDEHTPWLQLEWATLNERHASELPAGPAES